MVHLSELKRQHWYMVHSVEFSSVFHSYPTLCNPMNQARQASLSINNSRSPPKPMSIKLVMPPNHLILCRLLLLLPSVLPSIRVFSSELALYIRWPKNWSFSFSISPSNEYSRLISLRTDWFDLLVIQSWADYSLYYGWASSSRLKN